MLSLLLQLKKMNFKFELILLLTILAHFHD